MKSSSDEREEETWFRVSVCLERFFSDERARCFVSVSGVRRVRWLRRRLRRLFALPAPSRRLALLTQGHLLPPDERLSLLRPDDVVHVIPTDIDLETYHNLEPEVEHEDQCTKKTKWSSSIQQPTPSDDDDDSLKHESHEALRMNSAPTVSLTEDHKTINKLITIEPSSYDTLEEVKDRAIALLDTCAPLPRRRRLRRRRRPRRPPTDSLISDTSVPNVVPESNHCSENEELVRDHCKPINSEKQIDLLQDDIAYSIDGVDHRSTSVSPADRSLPPYTSTFIASTPQTPTTLGWMTGVLAMPNVVQNATATPRVARIVRPLESEIVPMM